MTTSASGTAPSKPNLGSMGAIKDEVMTRDAVEEPWAVFNPAAIRGGTNRNKDPLKMLSISQLWMISAIPVFFMLRPHR